MLRRGDMTARIRAATDADAEPCGRKPSKASPNSMRSRWNSRPWKSPPNLPSRSSPILVFSERSPRRTSGRQQFFSRKRWADHRRSFLSRRQGWAATHGSRPRPGAGRYWRPAGPRFFQHTFGGALRSVGFDVREPLLLMRGTPRAKPSSDFSVRPMTQDDVSGAMALYMHTSRHRASAMALTIGRGPSLSVSICERQNRIARLLQVRIHVVKHPHARAFAHEDADGGARTDLTLDVGEATGLFGETIDIGKPKARALSRSFRRKERLPNPSEGLRKDTQPVIANPQFNKVARDLAFIWLKRAVARTHLDDTAVRHSVPRVRDEVDQHEF